MAFIKPIASVGFRHSYVQLISLLSIHDVISGHYPITDLENLISSNVIADVSSVARLARQFSQNDTHAGIAQTLKRSITVGARLKGCLDELKHQAFPTHSWRRCVSRKKKRRKKKEPERGKIERINWPGKWDSLSLTPLSEWTIKISNMMFKAVGQANW